MIFYGWYRGSRIRRLLNIYLGIVAQTNTHQSCLFMKREKTVQAYRMNIPRIDLNEVHTYDNQS